MIKSSINLIVEHTKKSDVHSVASADISSNMFILCDSGIDFLPTEVMKGDKGDKTTGWLGADFNKTNKIWPWMWRNVDSYMRKKFDTLLVDANEHASKMCIAYLKLYNLPIPAKPNDKRSAAMNYKKESLNSKSIASNDLKIESLVRTTYVLTAQLKTSNEQNIENLILYYKQCIYELHHFDQKMKIISNERDKKPIWQMQYNNLNVPWAFEDLKNCGYLANVHDGKYQGEKGIQPVKGEFASKKGKFAANLMERLYCNKILNHLADSKESEKASKCALLNYYLKSYEFLNEKLKRGLPVPFIMNDKNECLFLFNDGPPRQFAFANHVMKLMGWNYFHLKHVGNATSPDSLLKNGLVKKCALLATKIEGTNEFCYTGISNDWLTLNELGVFRVMNEFNYKN